MSIEAKGVGKYYGKQKALDDVSFKISSGEIVGFLGPNGAGKSTMMKIITGYFPPNEGEIYVIGLDAVENSLEVRKKVGYLPEHNPLYPEMYVTEYLKFVAGIYKVKNKKERVEEIIKMVGLSPERHKKIQELSKGYKQRVGLAQALIHDPDVLVLDEPTSGLDPNQLVEIRKLIRDIGKEKTVMLSTHIMQEVEAICDRVIIINEGRIVADAPVSEMKNMGNAEGYSLEVEVNEAISEELLSVINGVDKVISNSGLNYSIEISSDKDIRAEISKAISDDGKAVLSMVRKEKSMEDVFKELTR
ncbi:MAG TPA: gliding motility-associated ABC transporter ATP-binding subunit GldA [Flavobacteriales bacterium]|nr:gliding motility-associated ABC transporter ATP-binding subunit GldA [Flavobacteriales bacterium]|tara:strand:- start:7051 stop:7959 length:909 start_codon:yes stop_codon:yes gene_type:complete